jgi:hypothetical protein
LFAQCLVLLPVPGLSAGGNAAEAPSLGVNLTGKGRGWKEGWGTS